jgi:arylsulfatase A-like enzyme
MLQALLSTKSKDAVAVRKKPLLAILHASFSVFASIIFISFGEYIFFGALGYKNEWVPIALSTLILGAAGAGVAGLLSPLLSPFQAIFAALLLPMVPFAYHGVFAAGFKGTLWIIAAIALASFPAAALAWTALSRTRIAILGLAAGCAFIGSWGLHATSGPAFSPARGRSFPDIVLLVMDTTRRDRLSVYGYPKPTTPNLEEFARKAEVYEDAWSVAPWTPASHASIFTGLLPALHGVDGQTEPPFTFKGPTIAKVLSSAGYRTAGFVANYMLHAPGWGKDFHVYLPAEFRKNHSLIQPLNFALRGFTKVQRLESSSERVLNRARSWWQATTDGPRFLFLNLIDPHWPYKPLEPFAQQFLSGVDPAEAYAKEYQDLEYYVKPGLAPRDIEIVGMRYDAEIAGMDYQIGRFVDWLRARGDLDRTIFVVTADHGERLGERGLLGHALVVDPYLLRVPLLVRYPPKLEPRRIDRRVQLDGIAGYVLDLAGVEAPQEMARSALHKLCRAAAVAQLQNPQWFIDRIHAEAAPDFNGAPYQADWSYAADERFFLSKPVRNPPENGTLTDYIADPNFERDGFKEHPKKGEELRAVGESLPPYRPVEKRELDAEAISRLRSIGYLKDPK